MIQQYAQQSFRDRIAYGLFWTWNLIFLAFMVLGFAPRILPEMFFAIRSGIIPLSFLINALILSLIPLAAIILGLTVLRSATARLFAMGYVVEGPLMLLLVIRFFVIRQAPLSLVTLMVIAILGMAAFLWYTLDPEIERRSRWYNLARLAGLTLMLLLSLYVAALITFYAVPVINEFLKWLWYNMTHFGQFLRDFGNFFDSLVAGGWTWIPFTLVGLILLLYTATLFVLTPIVVPILAVRAWLRNFLLQGKAQGWVAPAAVVLLTVVLSTTAFVVSNRQPQKQAFALLENPPASQEQAKQLLAKQDQIRAGLLNSYLAPFRYISAVGEVVHVSNMYQYGMGLTQQAAFQVESLYEDLALPLLYEPVHPQNLTNSTAQRNNVAFQQEPQEAAQLYQRFFDAPIIQGERSSIVRAVRSTWNGDQAEAAWQAVDDREVLLSQQEINIQEHGDWADVEVYEVYENQTQSLQEVIYYFNLPESAVLTGVWLGNHPERERRFAFQVAPRGAAQAVYRNETRIMRDPALLEQIGPRQYRLRIYPAQGVQVTWNENRTRRLSEKTTPLYMWMTYRTFAVDGKWPLPQLALKKNVYWDEHTLRKVNGQPVKSNEAVWMPEAVPASVPVQPGAHRVDFPGETSVLVVPAGQVQLPGLPETARLAVVLDRSKSMEAHAAEVTQAIDRLKNIPKAQVDVYLTSSQFRGEEASVKDLASFDAKSTIYYGGQNPADLVAQFENLQAGRKYDGILVLTDGGAYELGENKTEVSIPDAPVWMIHLGSDIPLGYDDRTLEVIQASGGGVVGSLDEALTRLAVSLSGRSGESSTVMRDVLDGYVWTVEPTSQAETDAPEATVHASDDGFVALMARRLVLAEIRRQRGAITQLETLDMFHALAKEYSIVTPYSSMIVLVNEQQQDILEHLEQEADRYQREYEDLKNTIPSTQAPLVGVPEPGEWLLIAAAMLMLGWYVYRQKLAVQRVRVSGK